MKNILLIILILVSTSSFSQVKIDTSEIKSIRFEWNIDTKTKDTTLHTKLTEYKSGFYIEKIEFMNDSTEFGHFFIYKSDNNDILTKTSIENHVTGMGNGIITTYFDKYRNPDSIVTLTRKPEFKKIFVPIEKRYKKKGKLDYISDLDGKNFYKYNLFGKLKRIEHFRDTTLYKISEYRKNHLISETFPTRKKYRKKFTYEYDKKGRIIKRDDNDQDFYRYQYNEFGLSKIEKIYKKRNMVTEYTLYIYDKNGILKRKKEFIRNDKLRNEYIYEYK
ncbi:hypothetical protein [Olleya sp. 1-3]|uniref:hypothetical protein n=1 Tax=Olleya sp. 1-3 TaxID=2058323 RepID=UPI000C33C507|nr:hypothetical protein [Olleya sp. 1-3]PKG50141.1 hypothetical protein CXF54_15650 [Olleya sp. 1-3]